MENEKKERKSLSRNPNRLSEYANRKRATDLSPSVQAKASDFDEEPKIETSKEVINEAPKNDIVKEITSVTFDTNIRITNHTRNKLQAVVSLAYTDSQKSAVDLLFSAFFESLTSEQQEEINLEMQVLERRDVRRTHAKK